MLLKRAKEGHQARLYILRCQARFVDPYLDLYSSETSQEPKDLQNTQKGLGKITNFWAARSRNAVNRLPEQ